MKAIGPNPLFRTLSIFDNGRKVFFKNVQKQRDKRRKACVIKYFPVPPPGGTKAGQSRSVENVKRTRKVNDRQVIADYTLLTADCSDRKSTRLNSSHVAISYAVF